ncbi:MAG TPA: serine hydroxymethyltransferase [Blastocatellia bacterium]|nr:serine hydroxymethyltransferase [Blastocatellia bacterium]
MRENILASFARCGVGILEHEDPALHAILDREYQRQSESLTLVAASSMADPSVLACEGTVISNVTTEGYPGARFHAGCVHADEIEQLAVDRAKRVFQARYVNVQPHSGTSANEIVLFSLLKPDDTLLGLALDCGGHLSHGAKVSVSGRYFNAIEYRLDQAGLIDYDQVADLARRRRPKLIICGASAYPRIIDFKRFRQIADETGAYLLADISHIAGLVAAGQHPSPIDHAHFTTTSMYKQLYGPRGGLILMGKDFDAPAPNQKGTLSELIQQALFPFFQGTPNLGAVAAKARALALIARPQFKEVARRIVDDAKALAERFIEHGYRVLTGGTDNHLILIDVFQRGITGAAAERALEECNIIINKNKIPGDQLPPAITSGIRLGTNSVALRGMGECEMKQCAELMQHVLSALAASNGADRGLSPSGKQMIRAKVAQLCRSFPVPSYPIYADRSQSIGEGAASLF